MKSVIRFSVFIVILGLLVFSKNISATTETFSDKGFTITKPSNWKKTEKKNYVLLYLNSNKKISVKISEAGLTKSQKNYLSKKKVKKFAKNVKSKFSKEYKKQNAKYQSASSYKISDYKAIALQFKLKNNLDGEVIYLTNGEKYFRIVSFIPNESSEKWAKKVKKIIKSFRIIEEDIISIESISPAFGYNDLNTAISITGTNFPSGATVKIGDTSAADTTVSSSTTITGTVSSGMTAGFYDVKIFNQSTLAATLTNGFEIKNPPAEWTKESLSWSGSPTALTSTCTIFMPDGTYRMYFTGSGGLWSATSTDGVNWSGQAHTGIVDLGATNPSVIRLTNGTYLMIYGIQTSMPTTETLYWATSSNGINFTKQGVALTAQAGEDNFVSVPDLIYINSTTLRMYFVASSSDSQVHTAISTNNGQTWTREGEISLTGGSIGGQTNDPDVISLSDGTYRLFFTTPPAGQTIGDLRVRSAISSDGRNFILESGSRVTPSGLVNVLMDPDVIKIPGADRYRLYYGANLTAGGADVLRSITSF